MYVDDTVAGAQHPVKLKSLVTHTPERNYGIKC